MKIPRDDWSILAKLFFVGFIMPPLWVVLIVAVMERWPDWKSGNL